MVPIGIVAGQGNWSSTAVFTINFFAIIPLAAVLSFATEQISVKLGEALGGLLNATFGNAVELIVSIVALKDGQIEVVQSSMLGSILSNLLLVMGMCFFFGGIVNMRDRVTGQGMEQSFASATAQTTCSLMTLSSASLVIPATVSFSRNMHVPRSLTNTAHSFTPPCLRLIRTTRSTAFCSSLAELPLFS